ncbi:glycosyltransferase family 2 protein [bacterium]|nr:glycosyltransferase family 2 protein [bacterium]
MNKKSSLALIVPCYNESESIPYFETEFKAFAHAFSSNFADFELTVVVVNNNSTDNSYELLKRIQEQNEGFFRVIDCVEQGYGAALKHGFASVDSQYICFLDLDNTYPMNSLIEMLKSLIRQNLDIIYGARIHKSSEISFIRYLGNQLYVVLLKYLFKSKLSDVCSGMRLFKAEHKSKILALKSNDLSFSIDFTALVFMNKLKYDETPILYRDRVGESKLSVIKDGFLFLWIVIRNYLNKK